MKIVNIVAVVLLVILLAAAGFYGWASLAARRTLARTIATHTVDFPIPTPLDSGEIRRLRLSPEAAAQLARGRALERGKHLVESRYACIECHGRDFRGGVMVDAPPIGRLLGPNLTSGRGSRTAQYGPADWDRIVRHGVRPDGWPAAMPSADFERMTDQELSDIVVYVQSQPAVDNEVPPVTLGPVGKVLIAGGEAARRHPAADADDDGATVRAEVDRRREVIAAGGRPARPRLSCGGYVFGAVAQLGEHRLCKPGVEGSNPFRSINDWSATGSGRFATWDTG